MTHGPSMRLDNDDFITSLMRNIDDFPHEPAYTSWNSSGKMKSWTWVKFHARAMAAAYEISEKFGLGPGDKCALMIPNSEPFLFLSAFFGCLLVEVIPMPIELPITNSRDGLTARFGFLLRSCNIEVVAHLRSEVPYGDCGQISQIPQISRGVFRAHAEP